VRRSIVDRVVAWGRQFRIALIQRSLYSRWVTTSTATATHSAALARLGHALSDPTRTNILLSLREAPAFPSDLADALGVSRQIMSNHLACLRGCGLVEATPEGRRSWYRLADPHLAPALDELLRVVLFVEPGCCAGEECTCA
jgi:DNA-binding transcriptional ArsR family regulator